jgi:hypothetical protein
MLTGTRARVQAGTHVSMLWVVGGYVLRPTRQNPDRERGGADFWNAIDVVAAD